MQLLPTDVVQRASRNESETIWVSERLIVALCDGLDETRLRRHCRHEYSKTVPQHRRKQDIMPDTGAAWRFAKIKGAWYYDLKSIPDKAPAKYRSRLPETETLLALHQQSLTESRQSELETMVKRSLKADYKGFLPAYAGHTTAQAEGLAKAAAVLHVAHEYARDQALDLRRMEFYSDFGAIVERLQVGYLPSNPRRLKEKLVRVLGGEVVTEVVTLPRAGNENAKKYDDPQIIAWLMTMRASGVNTTSTHIARQISLLCALYEKNAPSFTWLEHYLARPEVKQLTSLTRYGVGGRRALPWKAYVPLAGAAFSGDCWMMDGTRVNFIEYSEGDNKWQHMMVVMVYDVHSGAFLGRAYGKAENRWLYTEALAKAATTAGYLPFEIVSDRFPGYNTPEWQATTGKLERAGVQVHVTHKMQGKARLERAIDTVQMIGMQGSDKYYGQGVQSGRDYAHRAEEVLATMRKRAKAEGWNADRCILEAEKAFEIYNNTKYSEYSRERRTIELSPLELHRQSEKPHTSKHEWYELLHFYGLSKKIALRGQGMIVTEILKVKYTYVIAAAHYATIKAHKEVVMYYDLEDLTRVQLFSVAADARDEQFLCEATEQQAVQWHGPSKDGPAMGQARQRIRQWQDAQEAEMSELAALAKGTEDRLLMGQLHDKQTREQAESAYFADRPTVPAKRRVNPDQDADYVLSDNDIRGQY